MFAPVNRDRPMPEALWAARWLASTFATATLNSIALLQNTHGKSFTTNSYLTIAVSALRAEIMKEQSFDSQELLEGLLRFQTSSVVPKYPSSHLNEAKKVESLLRVAIYLSAEAVEEWWQTELKRSFSQIDLEEPYRQYKMAEAVQKLKNGKWLEHGTDDVIRHIKLAYALATNVRC